jgi:hypothetical protein
MATTQNKRRLTFGLNVFIGVVAALALSVLLCWLTFHNPKRWDFTHTRQYSLSEQTLTVLTKNMTEPHEVITLFSRPTGDPARAEQIERANDLVDEYTRRSTNLRAEHIVYDTDLTKVSALFERIKKRYADQLKPVINAITRGNEAAKALKELPKKLVPELTKLQQDPELKNTELRDYAQRAAQAFTSIDSSLDRTITAINSATSSESAKQLPNYAGSLNALRVSLGKIDSDLLAVVVAQFKHPSSMEKATIGVREQLLQIIDDIEKARKPLQDALASLRSVTAVEEYEKLRDQLSAQDTIVILGPKREAVIPLDEMFRQVDPKERDAMAKQGIPELAFLGEERLTGALLSLSMKVRPKVVFVYSGRRPAIGPQGNYNNVAGRLTKLNFEVDQWTPGPRPGPMGQPGPPGPPPTAEPGQKMVWVLLPTEPADERNPMGGRLGEQAVSVVMERLNGGDSGMVLLAPSPTARVNPTNPLVQALELYNLKPLTDRVVLHGVAVKTGETEASNKLDIHSWPDALPITKAIGGLNGVFLQGVPIEATPDKNKEVTTWPLVVATMPGMWAERDMMNFPNVKSAPDKAADSFTLAMAAETRSNRIIVVGDPVWASDDITGWGILGQGTAEMAGAVFPANAELFVNSMYWLAHLEDLIAASPRSQDIRRVHQMSRATHSAVRWSLFAGLPALALCLGVGVYLVRRRV